MAIVKLFLDQDEPTTELKIRPHLTPRQVIALGQFGRQLMGAGVTKQQIESLLLIDPQFQAFAAMDLVIDKLFSVDGEVGEESALAKAFYALLEVFTGFDAAQVRQLVNDDLLAIGKAIWEGQQVTEFGGFLGQMMHNIFPRSSDQATENTSEKPGESQPVEGATSGPADGSSSGQASNGGGTSNGGSTPSLDPSSRPQDGSSPMSLMASPTDNASSSAVPSLA